MRRLIYFVMPVFILFIQFRPKFSQLVWLHRPIYKTNAGSLEGLYIYPQL